MADLNRRQMLVSAAALLIARRSVLPALAQDAVEKKTLTYATRNGADLLLDLYLPRDARAPLPVVIFLHGGGWSGGSRTGGPDFAQFFARDGFAMVSIDYRLTPANQFPSNIEDVKTSIRFLRANAKEHGLDVNRFGLWGSSAGGHLAAMAALTKPGVFEGPDNAGQPSAVQCVLDAYGVSRLELLDTQLAAEQPTLTPLARGLMPFGGGTTPVPHDAPNSSEGMYLGAPIQTVLDKVRQANPVTYVTAGAPPFLLMHGLSDSTVPHQQSVMLYESLVAAGNEARLHLIDGLPHAFYGRNNVDVTAGPFASHVRTHPRGGAESATTETIRVYDVARAFFRRHLA